jgi:hypothetical protein
MITNRRLVFFFIANSVFGIAGYTGSTWAAVKTVALGDTGWSAQFNDKEVTDLRFTPKAGISGVLNVTTEFPDLTPVDILFIEKEKAAKDDDGLRITLYETVKNTHPGTNTWQGFPMTLIDTNPELKPADNANVKEGEPGHAHFHINPGQTFPPFTLEFDPEKHYGQKFISLIRGEFPAGDTHTWTGIGIHQIEEQGRQRDFIFRASPVPEPETYAMLLAGLGLLGFMARRKNSAG